MGKIVKMGKRSPPMGELGRDGSRRDSGRTGEASPNLDETGPQEPRNRIDGRKSLWENWVARL